MAGNAGIGATGSEMPGEVHKGGLETRMKEVDVPAAMAKPPLQRLLAIAKARIRARGDPPLQKIQ